MLMSKKGLVLKEVAGNYLIVPVGKTMVNFSRVININEAGAGLFRLLEKGTTQEAMVQSLTQNYDIDPATAAADVAKFLEKARANGLLETEA